MDLRWYVVSWAGVIPLGSPVVCVQGGRGVGSGWRLASLYASHLCERLKTICKGEQ